MFFMMELMRMKQKDGFKWIIVLLKKIGIMVMFISKKEKMIKIFTFVLEKKAHF